MNKITYPSVDSTNFNDRKNEMPYVSMVLI